jgi:hypothetical protein
MKTILCMGIMILGGYGLLGRVAGGAPRVADVAADIATEPTPLISTNEGGCWDKCKKCEEQCRSQSGDAKRSCDDTCWKTNDTCCSGVGGKGVYKMCGCTDK